LDSLTVADNYVSAVLALCFDKFDGVFLVPDTYIKHPSRQRRVVSVVAEGMILRGASS
jgi:hypothetical protein